MPPQLFRTLLLLLFRPFLPKAAAELRLENEALHHQVALLQRQLGKRPRLTHRDRIFWILLSRLWPDWRRALYIVQPNTVIRWHRQGFRAYWRRKSQRQTPGRPSISRATIHLIQRLKRENASWGAPRIHGELAKLGIQLALSTVEKYIGTRATPPPSQSWKTFLRNHVTEIAAIDFFVVPSLRFPVLCGFVVLSHDRREILHIGATPHPTGEWTAQQLTEAFPWDAAPRYLLRDNDSIYGELFRRRVNNLGMKDLRTAPRSPWQNAYAERVIGSIRRECLNHIIPINEAHLLRILREYQNYYNHSRTHLSLDGDTPEPRPIQTPEMGSKIVALPQVGGLHHRYERRAA